MHGTHNIPRQRAITVLAGGLVCTFVLFLTLELFLAGDGLSFLEFLFEAVEFGLAVGIASGIIYLAQQVETARAQSRIWQNEARLRIDGLQSAIPHQFESWGMTKAEEEIGILVLKGSALMASNDPKRTSAAFAAALTKSPGRSPGLNLSGLRDDDVAGLDLLNRQHRYEDIGTKGRDNQNASSCTYKQQLRRRHHSLVGSPPNARQYLLPQHGKRSSIRAAISFASVRWPVFS